MCFGVYEQILSEMLTKMQNCYRARLYKAYCLNTPSTISILWGIAKLCMEESTISKITLENGRSSPKLFEHVNPDQVEVKYGGKAPNKTDNYWPPREISPNYFLPSDAPEKILLSKDFYKKMHQAKMLEKNKVSQELLA
jgi:CRAL/TRIO domain